MTELTRERLIDWLITVRSDLKDGDVTNVYTRVCQMIKRLEESEYAGR